MMNCYDVNIRVPSQEAKSDLVIISGVPSNVEAAKVKHESKHNIWIYLLKCASSFFSRLAWPRSWWNLRQRRKRRSATALW